MRALIVACAFVLATPAAAAAQNVLTSRDDWILSIVAVGDRVRVNQQVWLCSAHDGIAAAGYRLLLDEQLASEVGVDALVQGLVCFSTMLTTPGNHTARIVAYSSAGDTRSTDVTTIRALADVCTYAPSPTAASPTPPLETRPLGYAIDGQRPWPQTARIGQLRSWGWRVEWQLRDATNTVAIQAWCDPQ